VNWYGAKACALYYGLDLPTESEWEYACRGGRNYQYGTDDGTLSITKANFQGVGHLVDAGSYPANPYGLYDMCGNAWEWCHDWFGLYQSDSLENPSGPEASTTSISYPCRVVRGGFFSDARYLRSADRHWFEDTWGAVTIGFRVVRRASGVTY
jgi:formylglycine-generating enzyme